jgi:hypothetical protein
MSKHGKVSNPYRFSIMPSSFCIHIFNITTPCRRGFLQELTVNQLFNKSHAFCVYFFVSRTTALGSTQPLTDMSVPAVFWGVKGGQPAEA